MNDLDGLIQAARSGNAAGLAEIYERYAPALYRTAYRLAGSASDAEDVVHDVFVGLPEALRRYEERGDFAAWLRRVTVRRTLMRARSDRRRREVTLDEFAPMPGPDAGALVEAAEIHRAVHAAVRRLPDSLRAVLVLRQFEGYSHEEVAAMLGISVGASRVRLARALVALRRALGDER